MAENPYQIGTQERVRRLKWNQMNDKTAKRGVISPLGNYKQSEIFVPQIFSPFADFLKGTGNTLRGMKNTFFPSPRPKEKVQAAMPKISPTIMPTREPTRMPTRIPTQVPVTAQRMEPLPEGPATPKRTAYTQKKEWNIEPNLYNAIINSPVDDTFKRMAFALATQESSGGYNKNPDDLQHGGSWGPYHIIPKWHPELTKETAMDPVISTAYLMKWMQKRRKAGVPDSQLVKDWNKYHVNPDYGIDIPQRATMSAFLKGT